MKEVYKYDHMLAIKIGYKSFFASFNPWFCLDKLEYDKKKDGALSQTKKTTTDLFKTRFGLSLLYLNKDLKIPQTKLAKIFKIPQQSVSQYIRESTNI